MVHPFLTLSRDRNHAYSIGSLVTATLVRVPDANGDSRQNDVHQKHQRKLKSPPEKERRKNIQRRIGPNYHKYGAQFRFGSYKSYEKLMRTKRESERLLSGGAIVWSCVIC